MLNIRIAVPEDHNRINELFVEMLKTVYHTDEAQGYEAGYLDKFWSSGEDRIYVAEDSKIVAFLSVEVHREQELYLYLDDFSVTEDYRNQGIGTALMNTAEAYAKEKMVPAIFLHVEKTNGAAFHFYDKLGFSVYRDDGERYLLRKILN